MQRKYPAIRVRDHGGVRVILNTSDGLQGSVSVAYAYGKSEPQFTKVNNWMMSVCREQGLLGRTKERDVCVRLDLGMGRLALEFPPRQWPDGPSPSCFAGVIVH